MTLILVRSTHPSVNGSTRDRVLIFRHYGVDLTRFMRLIHLNGASDSFS